VHACCIPLPYFLHLLPAFCCPLTVHASDSEVITGVAWTPGNELWACSDDQAIWRWTAEGDAPAKVNARSQ
jgi:hypothetical protein